MQEQIIRDNNKVINELMGVVRDPSEVRAILFKTSQRVNNEVRDRFRRYVFAFPAQLFDKLTAKLCLKNLNLARQLEL